MSMKNKKDLEKEENQKMKPNTRPEHTADSSSRKAPAKNSTARNQAKPKSKR